MLGKGGEMVDRAVGKEVRLRTRGSDHLLCTLKLFLALI